MGEHLGICDDADADIERKGAKIEIEVSDEFKIHFIAFINSLKELNNTVKSWRER
jgi:hypothetical protein